MLLYIVFFACIFTEKIVLLYNVFVYSIYLGFMKINQWIFYSLFLGLISCQSQEHTFTVHCTGLGAYEGDTELKQFTDDLQKRRLVVKVTSFAYKKGIPEDSSGNGGGFVFDCRAVNNPGKYDRYKPFTGLDEPVIRFLEDVGEITTFLEHVYGLVDASVKRYMERGFTNLSICFGCTGGQHRSVYSAQHLAEHLNQKFGVQVNLMHREQNIEQTFKAKS